MTETRERETREHDREACAIAPCSRCMSRLFADASAAEYLDSLG
jgi:hypothetical protein